MYFKRENIFKRALLRFEHNTYII